MSEQFMIMGPGEYRTRGGNKATVTTVTSPAEGDDPTDRNYVAFGYVEDSITRARYHYSFTRRGRLFEDRGTENDIVGPWVEEKKEEPPPLEVPPGLVVNEKALFSEAPKTTSQLVDQAFEEFRARLNQVFNGRIISLVASISVDAGDKEKLTLVYRGPFSSAIGAVEWTKRKLVDELERSWR